MTKETVRLLDLTNPDRASSALATAVRKISETMSRKGDTIANLAEDVKISVQGDWLKLAGLIERLTTLADAPELLASPSATQWGISISGFIVGILNDPDLDGALFTVQVGPARRPLQIAATTRDAVGKKLALPSPGTAFAQCLQSIDTSLRHGTVIRLAVIPDLTPLFSLDMATDDAYKSGSGVTPFWFDPP